MTKEGPSGLSFVYYFYSRVINKGEYNGTLSNEDKY